MKRRHVATSISTAITALAILASAAPSYAGTERSDGMNECMQAAEGGCSNGPFDGSGSHGGVQQDQASLDRATAKLWNIFNIYRVGGSLIELMERTDGAKSTWSNTTEYSRANDRLHGVPEGTTTCIPGPGKTMGCYGTGAIQSPWINDLIANGGL